MHALGIPTTRALAVVATGQPVPRETALPGAVLGRVAASHIRVGTFEYAAAPRRRRAPAPPRRLRHRPPLPRTPPRPANPLPRRFYAAVVDAQAALVAHWMLVGFIHGVMNTDNMTISGETIDYGPCAFMDAFDPAAVFSSIDHRGRYAFGNQPVDRALEPGPPGRGAAAADRRRHRTRRPPPRGGPRLVPRRVRGALARRDGGQARPRAAADDRRARRRPAGAAARRSTSTSRSVFRALLVAHRTRPRALFFHRRAFDAWAARSRRAARPRDRAAMAAGIYRVNPLYIPRNHRVDEALTAATAGDLGPFHALLEGVGRPFTPRPGLELYAGPGGVRHPVCHRPRHLIVSPAPGA